MRFAVLATKLFIPPRPAHRVHRPRLTDRLAAAPPPRLTLISAPAGFGKTSLVTEWARSADRPIAWLSLDETDGDPARFLVGVISALQTVAPKLGEGTLARLQAADPESTDALVAGLVNEITIAGQALTLVLDDYHLVESGPVDDLVAFLLDHLPPQLHVVIASREDPQLPLARYRSRGQLVELREADLRFNAVEAATFLDEAMGLRLTEQEVAALEARTEGWIVGLQLAALSMQGRQDTTSFIESFTGTNRFVLDYLLEEVLHRQTAAVQAFLLDTSILERLSGALCDAVVPPSETPAQETLEALERANLFVVPLDLDRRWYRYHHLFAQLLRDRLARRGPDHVASLHRRASDWFARNDLPEAAVAHALAARDWTRAADLIERFSDQWPMRVGAATTVGWLEAMPVEVLLDRPGLGLTYAWSLFIGHRLERAEQFLAQLAPRVAAEPNHLAEVFAVRVMVVANRGGMDAVAAMGAEALSLVSRDTPTPRARILISLGAALADIGGDLDGAKRAFGEADELARMSSPPTFVGNAPLPLTAMAYLAEIEWQHGSLRTAGRIQDEALALAAEWGNEASIGLSLVQLGRASLLYERNALEQAEVAVSESIRIGEAWRNPRVLVPALGVAAAVARARGRPDQARAAAHRAAQLARDSPTSGLLQVAIATLELDGLTAGEGRRTVERWQAYLDAESASLPARLADALAAALARGWFSLSQRGRDQDDLRRARSLVDPALERSRRDGRRLDLVRLLLVDSLLLRAAGQPEAAMQSLEQVLEEAAREGYARSILDLGEPMEALVRRTVDRSKLPEPILANARRLLARFQPVPPADAVRDADADGDEVEPLTRRELEVLRLIADGLSNREIADRLFLALSTVKGHARIVFDKLGVSRRTEAVARARSLGLL